MQLVASTVNAQVYLRSLTIRKVFGDNLHVRATSVNIAMDPRFRNNMPWHRTFHCFTWAARNSGTRKCHRKTVYHKIENPVNVFSEFFSDLIFSEK